MPFTPSRTPDEIKTKLDELDDDRKLPILLMPHKRNPHGRFLTRYDFDDETGLMLTRKELDEVEHFDYLVNNPPSELNLVLPDYCWRKYPRKDLVTHLILRREFNLLRFLNEAYIKLLQASPEGLLHLERIEQQIRNSTIKFSVSQTAHGPTILIGPIGQGSYGTVEACQNILSGEIEADKIYKLPTDLPIERKVHLLGYLLQELKALQLIDSAAQSEATDPNVQYYIDQLDRYSIQQNMPHTQSLPENLNTLMGFEKYCLFQPYLYGNDLERELVNNSQHYSKGDRLHIALLAIKIITAVHAKGIIHCDIKGKNFKILRTPRGLILSLCDWNFALEKGAGPLQKKNQTDSRGTPGSIAPEIVVLKKIFFKPYYEFTSSSLGKGPVYSESSDIFAYGRLLVELFQSSIKIDDFNNVDPKVSYVTKTPDAIDSAIHDLAILCTRKNPNLRPTDSAVENYLNECITNQPFSPLITFDELGHEIKEQPVIVPAALPEPPESEQASLSPSSVQATPEVVPYRNDGVYNALCRFIVKAQRYHGPPIIPVFKPDRPAYQEVISDPLVIRTARRQFVDYLRYIAFDLYERYTKREFETFQEDVQWAHRVCGNKTASISFRPRRHFSNMMQECDTKLEAALQFDVRGSEQIRLSRF